MLCLERQVEYEKVVHSMTGCAWNVKLSMKSTRAFLMSQALTMLKLLASL